MIVLYYVVLVVAVMIVWPSGRTGNIVVGKMDSLYVSVLLKWVTIRIHTVLPFRPTQPGHSAMARRNN